MERGSNLDAEQQLRELLAQVPENEVAGLSRNEDLKRRFRIAGTMTDSPAVRGLIGEMLANLDSLKAVMDAVDRDNQVAAPVPGGSISAPAGIRDSVGTEDEPTLLRLVGASLACFGLGILGVLVGIGLVRLFEHIGFVSVKAMILVGIFLLGGPLVALLGIIGGLCSLLASRRYFAALAFLAIEAGLLYGAYHLYWIVKG
jgi:hypothetical protein